MASACAGRGESSPTPLPVDERTLTAAPAWIDVYCTRAAATIGRQVLCPARVPAGLSETENAAGLQPSRTGYLFEANGPGSDHWVFSASLGSAVGGYGPMEALGDAIIRGRRASFLAASERAGIHALHLLLAWREGLFGYVVSVHAPAEQFQANRALLLTVAKGMRAYG